MNPALPASSLAMRIVRSQFFAIPVSAEVHGRRGLHRTWRVPKSPGDERL